MIRKAMEYLGSGVLVYVGVAACSASGAVDSMMEATGGMFGSGASGASKSSGGREGPGAEAAGGLENSGGDGSGAMSAGSGAEGAGAVMGSGATQGSGSVAGSGATEGGGGSIMNPVPEAKAEDGTRIVNLYRTTPGGLKTPEGYWDKELETQCNFGVAEDGKTRCIPTWSASISSYFSDAACSQPVAMATKGTCISGYATQADNTDCVEGTTYKSYEIGQKLTDPGIYSGTPDDCTEISESLYNSLDFYSVTKVDPNTLAEGSLVQGGG